MWCTRCQLDIPSIVSAGPDARTRCARCGTRQPTPPSDTRSDFADVSQVLHQQDLRAAAPLAGELRGCYLEGNQPPIDLEAANWEPDGHRVELLIRALERSRCDKSEFGVLRPTPTTDRRQPQTRRVATPVRVAWAMVTLGLLGLSLGAVWLGSMSSDVSPVWNRGAVATDCGAIVTLAGTVLLLGILWRSTCQHASKLASVEMQLSELHSAAAGAAQIHNRIVPPLASPCPTYPGDVVAGWDRLESHCTDEARPIS